MIQTYQGYFGDDGRFVPDGIVMKIPVGRRAIVNILDDEVVKPKKQTVNQQQAAAVKKFLSDIAAISDEDNVLTDTDWDEMANLRSQTNAGLTRKINL
jgi:hypothetical protein